MFVPKTIARKGAIAMGGLTDIGFTDFSDDRARLVGSALHFSPSGTPFASEDTLTVDTIAGHSFVEIILMVFPVAPDLPHKRPISPWLAGSPSYGWAGSAKVRMHSSTKTQLGLLTDHEARELLRTRLKRSLRKLADKSGIELHVKVGERTVRWTTLGAPPALSDNPWGTAAYFYAEKKAHRSRRAGFWIAQADPTTTYAWIATRQHKTGIHRAPLAGHGYRENRVRSHFRSWTNRSKVQTKKPQWNQLLWLRGSMSTTSAVSFDY